MFTGLVEEIGTVSDLTSDPATGTAMTITLPADATLLHDCQQGDSIAVNGVCLTVTSFTPGTFQIGVAPETLRVTNLGALDVGGRVNLERAVRADTRMGGHFVQGHVDTTAQILAVTPDGEALTFRFRPARREMLRYIVYKGFVALDGTSLTVTQVNDAEGWFEIMLISYSQEKVVMARKNAGDSVNIEVDMMAKYAEKSVAGMLGGLDEEASPSFPFLEKIVQRLVAQAMSGKRQIVA